MIVMKKSNVAVIVGHSGNSQGYYSPFLEMSEYEYNSELATYLDCADIYYRPEAAGYNKQMDLLAEKLNPKDYDLVIELHFNMYDGVSNEVGDGCEVFIYPGNETTKAFGQKYCDVISKEYDIVNRGVKERTSGRGVGFLTKMKAPAIIVEPFFGDEKEAKKFENIKKHSKILNKLILKFLHDE